MADVDADAWATAVVTAGGTVSNGQRAVLSDLCAGLKADSIFSKLQRFWPIYAEASVTAAGAYVDVIARASATPVGSPTWAALSGITTTATKYLNLGTPGASPFLQNSASIGFDKLDTVNPPTVIQMGTTNTSGAVISYVAIRAGDTFCYACVNAGGAAADTVQATPSNGIWIDSRTAASGAGSSVLYRDGASAASGTNPASTGVPNQNFVLGGYLDSTGTFADGGGGSSQIFGMAMIGGGLTAAEVANLGTRWNTYKADLAAWMDPRAGSRQQASRFAVPRSYRY